jgi:organic radical activating enzyme
MYADVVVLTHKKEIRSISVSDLKNKQIDFTNWFCPITDHVVNATHDGTFKSGICNEIQIHGPKNPWWDTNKLNLPKNTICSFRKKQCFCNADLKSPKAKNKAIYNTFLKIATYKDYPYIDEQDEIYAVVGKNYLLNPLFEFHIDIGKRCNFDCSYCPSTIHDNHSPFLSLDSLKKLIDMVEATIYNQNKIKRCILTGGEPTLFKDIIKLIDLLQSKNYKIIINTNGTASKKLLTQLLEKNVLLIISLHNEFTNTKLIEKINKLKIDYPSLIDIKYMGQKDIEFYTSTIKILGEENIKVYPVYDKTGDDYKL